MPTPRSKQVPVIEAITKPLGFFVLALLIVESFLAAVLVGSTLPAEQKYVGMWTGVALFVLVVVVVSVLVWFRPRNLMFDQTGHLVDSGKIPYGSNVRPLSRERLEALPNEAKESK